MTVQSPLAASLLRQQFRAESFASGRVYADMQRKIAWDIACQAVFRWWRL